MTAVGKGRITIFVLNASVWIPLLLPPQLQLVLGAMARLSQNLVRTQIIKAMDFAMTIITMVVAIGMVVTAVEK